MPEDRTKRPGRPQKPRQKPFYAEFHAAGFHGRLEVPTLTPLVLQAHLVRGRVELFHTEVRLKCGWEEIAEAFAGPEVGVAVLQGMSQLGDALKNIAEKIKEREEAGSEESLSGAAGPDSADELVKRVMRARKVGHAAAMAKAEELGITEPAEKHEIIQRAYDDAYTAAMQPPEPDGSGKDE